MTPRGDWWVLGGSHDGTYLDSSEILSVHLNYGHYGDYSNIVDAGTPSGGPPGPAGPERSTSKKRSGKSSHKSKSRRKKRSLDLEHSGLVGMWDQGPMLPNDVWGPCVVQVCTN